MTYDYLELLDCYAYDVERYRREIESMRRARHGVAKLEPEPAGTDGRGLYRAGDLRRDGPKME
jgi:hypothetical protein